MTDLEVNKIISEFMDDESITQTMLNMGRKKYTESLDSLVPVWEKLDNSYNHYGRFVWLKELIYNAKSEHMKTIQQAAAYATAKAIKELER